MGKVGKKIKRNNSDNLVCIFRKKNYSNCFPVSIGYVSGVCIYIYLYSPIYKNKNFL